MVKYLKSSHLAADFLTWEASCCQVDKYMFSRWHNLVFVWRLHLWWQLEVSRKQTGLELMHQVLLLLWHTKNSDNSLPKCPELELELWFWVLPKPDLNLKLSTDILKIFGVKILGYATGSDPKLVSVQIQAETYLVQLRLELNLKSLVQPRVMIRFRSPWIKTGHYDTVPS